MWPKEKLLMMSNFTFGYNVFKSRLLLLHQNQCPSICLGVSESSGTLVQLCHLMRMCWNGVFIKGDNYEQDDITIYLFIISDNRRKLSYQHWQHLCIWWLRPLNLVENLPLVMFYCLTHSYIQQICSRRLWKSLGKSTENPFKSKNNSWIPSFVAMFSKSRLLQRHQKVSI